MRSKRSSIAVSNFPYVSIVLILVSGILRLVGAFDSLSSYNEDTPQWKLILQSIMPRVGAPLYTGVVNVETVFHTLVPLLLVAIELHNGHMYTLLVLLVAYLNYGANLYYRGITGKKTCGHFPCCGSYFYWTYIGVFFVTLASFLLKRRRRMFLGRPIQRDLARLALLIPVVAILVLTIAESTVWHHAHGLVVGYVFALLFNIGTHWWYRPRIAPSE